MLVNCNSCQKKFSVPDSAITEAGRLLQCGYCENKWTQYPIKEKLVKETKKITTTKIKQPTNLNKIKNSVKKKKRKINLYSEEYLKNKYGLTIEESSDHHNRNKKNGIKTTFSFYNYLVTIGIFIIALFGVINLSKDVVITNYPGTELYINYLYEIIYIIKITILEIAN
jgi:predicted Zn finger-like uncharacterized protein